MYSGVLALLDHWEYIATLLHYSYTGTIDKSDYLSFSINDTIFEIEKFCGILAVASMCVGRTFHKEVPLDSNITIFILDSSHFKMPKHFTSYVAGDW